MTATARTKTAGAKRTRSGPGRTTARARNSRRFVVDRRGRPTAALIPIREYEKLLEAMENLEDPRAADEAQAEDGEPIPWEQVKAELRAAGKLR